MKKMRNRWSALLLAAAMVLSLLPTAALAAPARRTGEVTIDVTDYGADPTGAKESSTAVIAAIAAAKKLPDSTPKTIYFPEGEYHFYEDYSEVREWYVSNTLRWDESQEGYNQKHIGILVENMENVTIDGGGSMFIFHGNMTTIAAVNSKNVTFQNFSEDFASPEVVDVTVESHEGDNAAILFVPACYNFTISGTNINWTGEKSPVTGQPYWSGNNGFLSYKQYVDTISGRHITGGKDPFNGVSSLEKIDDTHIKVTYSNASNRPPVGQSCQMRHPNPRKTPGTFFWQSENITVQNANFHFLHGFGMVSQLSKNITLDHVNCVPRPGTGRTSAGFADFVQMSSIAGDVIIRNCNFAGPHDDPINVHGTFLKVAQVDTATKRVKVTYQNHETWGFPQYYVGDKVDFTVQNTLAHVENSECTVVAVTNPGEGTNLDGTARSKNNENDMKSIIVTLDRIPDGIGTGHVMENVTYIPNVTIENCHFTEVPTRAILVTSSKKVEIKNNYFDRIRTSTIFISNDAQGWWESGRTEDVLISGNTFVAQATSNNDDGYGYSAIIMVWPTNTSNDPNYQIHKNMRIEGNTFYIAEGMPSGKNIITAKSVKDLTIKNNRFLRFDPKVSLALTDTGTGDLSVGASRGTSLDSSAFQFSERLYRLQACKNVIFEGNVYDNGLNKGIRMDETAITTADQIHDNDGGLTYNANNQLPAVGEVRYFSSDPAVAVVDASGTVTGVSAGTAEIYAYTSAGGRTFESNHLTFTVSGAASTAVEKIDVTGADAVDVNGTIDLTATVTPAGAGSVAWAVKPMTEGAEASIDASTGALTGTAPGVVEVTATLGGLSGSKLVTVNTPRGVNEAWTVKYPSDTQGWTLDAANNTISIDASKGSGDYNDGTGARNFFVTDVSSSDFELTVKLNTAACGNSGCYDEAGLIVSVDHNNYVSVVRKNQGNGYWLSIIKNNNATANEKNINEAAANRNSPVYLKLAKSGNTYTGSYSYDGTTWNTINTQENTLSNFQVGFFATNCKTANRNFVFEQFTLKEGTGAAAPISMVSTNTAPTATGVAVTSASPLTLEYIYNDDHDDEAGSVLAWYVSDSQTGHFTRLENANGRTLPVTAAISEKWVKAVVVPGDATGRYGAPVASAAVQAPRQTVVQDDATLTSLAVAGASLSPAFAPNITEYTVDVPASVTAVTVTAAPSQKDAAVAGASSVELTELSTPVKITVTAPDGSTTETYTITVRRAPRSGASLTALTAAAGGNAITYASSTHFYQLTAADGASDLAVTAAADPGASIAVRFNNEELGEYTEELSLPLAAGLNHLELRVTAQDGLSTALYRVAVMKPAASNADLSALTVNSTTDGLAAIAGDEGLVRLPGSSATITATPADANASVLISVDGKAATAGEPIELTQAVSTAQIRVVAEDTVTQKVYTLKLAKTDPTSAALAVLKVDGLVFDEPFDPETTTYTATSYGNASVDLRAMAAQADAAVTYETVAEYKSGEGEVTGPARFFGDVEDNTIVVTVTSPDGEHTKTYTITVDVVDSVYLSDLNWKSATVGDSAYSAPCRDHEWSGTGNKVSLIDANGAKVEFDKGIGTHANSTIVYDLSTMGFTTFTAKVGVSYAQYRHQYPNLHFRVRLDGEEAYYSGEMLGTTAYKEVEVSLGDASTLELNLTQVKNSNWNAHGNWADAKLSTTIPSLANTDVPIADIQFAHASHTLYANVGDPAHTVELHPVIKPVGVDQSAHVKVLNWESSDTDVATVVGGEDNNGVVTAVGVGETTITATALSGAEATCTITVKQKIEGQVAVSGALKFGSELTADINDIAEAAKDHLSYQWYRGDRAEGAVLGTEKTYTPVKEDIDSKLTVKVTASDPYEGTTSFTTAVIEKADGPVITGAGAEGIHGVAATEAGNDGRIVGFPNDGHTYEYKAKNAPESAYEEVNGAAVTGLAPGDYNVRIQATDTHKASTAITVTVSAPDVEEYMMSIGEITPAGSGNTVTRFKGQAAAGATRTLVIRPAEGYELETLTVTGESGNEVEKVAPGDPYEDETDGKTYDTYTFVMPAENVTVTANFAKKTYTIDHQLTNISCDMAEHDHTVTHGETFSITLTPDEGYDMPRGLTVTTTDGGVAFTDFTYTADPADPARRVLSFTHGVTASVTVKGAAILKRHTVVYHLTSGLRAPNAPQTATHGVDFQVALEAVRGYALPQEIQVTIGGEDYTGFTYDPKTGSVTIPGEDVTGGVVITAAGAAQGVPLQTVTLVGPARVGRTLRADLVPVLATVTYHWLRMDGSAEMEIAGATGPTYEITPEDEGKQLRVWVEATGGYTGELTSATTAVIQPAADPFVFVSSVTLDKESAELKMGQTLRLKATVAPENATSPVLFWASDNEAIARVDQNGVVTAVEEGTVTISASSTDTVDNQIAYCQVTVTRSSGGSTGTGGGGSSTPAETTKTETKPDGTKVTTVTKADGTKTETAQRPDGSETVTVTTPKGAKTITVTDPAGEQLAKVQIPAVLPVPETKFIDMDQAPWAEKAVNNVAGLKLVEGIGGSKYDPVTPMTRGSLATVLHRLSQGKTDYQATFKDVAAGKYYTAGVAWAAKAGVVTGISADVFAPEKVITREQLAVMLARYADLIGLDTKADAKTLDQFTDGKTTGDWAVDGVAWCVKTGILQGKGENNLDPTTNVTRAEVAVMLDRFISLLK